MRCVVVGELRCVTQNLLSNHRAFYRTLHHQQWAQSEIVGERFIRGIALALYIPCGVRVLRD